MGHNTCCRILYINLVFDRLLLPYERYDKGRNIEKKQSKHHKDEPSTTDREDNSRMTPTEDGFSKPRRVGI